MQWSELFDDEHEPLDNQIKEFVDSPLWDDLANYLHQTYDIHPKLFYSRCSMQKGFWKGWNVKYKKTTNPCVSFTQNKVTLLRSLLWVQKKWSKLTR